MDNSTTQQQQQEVSSIENKLNELKIVFKKKNLEINLPTVEEIENFLIYPNKTPQFINIINSYKTVDQSTILPSVPKRRKIEKSQ